MHARCASAGARSARIIAEEGGRWGDNTQATFFYVPDPDAHYARAKAAGADIMQPPQDTPYGARAYYVRDLEGFLWGFSTYTPAP
jgi:uncharacterized glyoxalase superfamily protein PhnB